MAQTVMAIVGGLVGLGGLIFGLYQYAVAQKWKQAEFAAGQLLRLNTEPELYTCCLMLDWREREIVVPERLRVRPDEERLHHSCENLREAMRPETEKHEFTWEEAICRELFDVFFTYLENINHFLDIGLIRRRHVAALRYWLEQVAQPRHCEEPVFEGFLKHYEYTGVLELMDRLGVSR